MSTLFRLNERTGLVEPVPDAPNPETQWTVDENEMDPDGPLELYDPQGWRSATVREDGCVEYYRHHNAPCTEHDEQYQGITDYLHICDIDDEIIRLQALKAMARRHFGPEWGE